MLAANFVVGRNGRQFAKQCGRLPALSEFRGRRLDLKPAREFPSPERGMPIFKQ
jgi:hypothetical protein